LKVIADFCVVPLGVGTSVSAYIAKCQEIVEKSLLSSSMHAYGTNIEGEWEEVFAVVKQCHQAVHQMGAARIVTTMKFGTRTDREQTMQEKIESVLAKRTQTSLQ